MKAKRDYLVDMARAYAALADCAAGQAVVEVRESVYDLVTDEDVEAAIEKLTKEFAPAP